MELSKGTGLSGGQGGEDARLARNFLAVVSCVDITTLNGLKPVKAEGWGKSFWLEFVSSDDHQLPDWFIKRKKDLPPVGVLKDLRPQ